MAYTTHGHYIPESPYNESPPSSKARCGGPGMCGPCSSQASQYSDRYGPTAGFEPEILAGDNSANYQTKAMHIVRDFIDSQEPGKTYETYVVWFSKILLNWKALVSTTLEDGMYYEVTYNGVKHESYLDAYKKRVNIVVADK